MSSVAVFLARLCVKLRYLVLIGVIGGAVVAMLMLPPIKATEGASLNGLAPAHSRALGAERVSAQQFRFPLLTRTMVVIRNPNGLPVARQLQLTRLSVRLTRGKLPGFSRIAGAVPLSNTLRIPALVRERGTTMVIYLYFRPGVGAAARAALAAGLVDRVIGHRPGEYEGVTGETVAALQQSAIINGHLRLVELATIALLALVLALRFRALGAPVLVLTAVAVAYLVSGRVVGELTRLTAVPVPAQIRPVLVVLIFGVTTDYSVFFVSRFRTLLQAGHDPREAAAEVLRQIAPIVTVAGLTVALGTAGLVAANLSFLRAFGPGLAVAVLTAMVVSVTMVPAALAVLGRALYWPNLHARTEESHASRKLHGPSAFVVRSAVRHPLVAAVLVLAGVAAAATGLGRIAIGNELIAGLPSNAGAARAYEQAKAGFTPGVVAPAVVVVTGSAVGQQLPALQRLQQELARASDVGVVLGSGQLPLADHLGFAVSRSGDAARYLLFLRGDPLGARAIGAIRKLNADLPGLLARAGLRGSRAAVAGDTAVSAEVVDGTITSLERVLPVVLCLIFIVIAAYLRALVAPLYLMLTSVLAVVAALGLTVYVMQELVGYGALTYYTLFTVAVLLISLGSDYNVFVVGRIWQEGRRRKLPEAVEVAGARAARPITTAGLVLALSFGLLAVVPLRGFREIAFAMFAGLIIDAFVVRPILVPALVTLWGRRSGRLPRSLRQAAE